MLPTLSIGPAVIPTASLVYILGIWLALILVEKAAKRLELHVPWTYNLATIALAAGFIGARLVFVATHWSAYSQNLLGIIWPLTSGFNLWAGLAIALAAGFFYGRVRGLQPGATADALTPGILVGFFTISLADFLAGPGYGTESSLPWSVTLFGIQRHPVQLYEIISALVALAAWIRLTNRRNFPGQSFLVATAFYSAGRLFVDAYRADSLLIAGGYHLVQIVALVVLVGALVLLMRQRTSVTTQSE